VAGPVARYRLTGVDDPELAPRIFGQFARRGIVPAAAQLKRSAGRINIRIDADGLDMKSAELVAETLRAQFLVEDVRLDFKEGPS
jgi:hypothetical protein